MDSMPSRAHILDSTLTSTPNTATSDSNSVVPKHVESISPSLAPVSKSFSNASNEAKSVDKTEDVKTVKVKRKIKGTPRGIEHKPRVMRKAIAQLVESVGSKQGAADLMGIPRQTLKNIITRCPDDVVAVKKELSNKFALASERFLERSLDRIEELNGYQSGILACASTDKVIKLNETAQSNAPQLNMLLQVLTAKPQAPYSVSDVTVVDAETKE